jgi:PKD repeat protein
MKRIYKSLSLLAIFTALLSLTGLSQNAWINEVHYDNTGTDVDEFIEVVIQNPGSYSLADFAVVLYNGNNGASYDTKTLDLFTVGVTTNGYTFYHYNYTANGGSIQNGAPDGMALSYQSALISGQWLSYEGTFAATDGPASGLTSVDIGVAETGSTPVGESLQLTGSGAGYNEFAWLPPALATPGQLNNGQSLGGAPMPEPSNYPTAFTATVYKISITLTWTDATGTQLPSNYLVKVSDQDNITAPVDGVPVPNDFDYSDGIGAINVPYGNETCLAYPLNGETGYFFKIYPYTNGGANINYKTDGTAPSASATTVPLIHFENFESNSFGTWTMYSVASDKDWGVVNFGGAYSTTFFAQMNGYAEDVPSNDWIISPSLNLDIYGSELLEFFTQWKYGDTDQELTLKYSTTYTGGNPALTNWTDLSFTKPSVQDIWVSSGDVSLAGISGSNVHIAFQYLSSGTPRRWGVDEILITGGASGPYISVTSPVVGDNWEQGSTHDITWSASNTEANVMIELSTNASSGSPTWTTLVASVPANAGVWTWVISPSQTTSNDCKIRITDFTSDTYGLSGIFSIVEPIYIPRLMITEIMYNPPESGTDSLEFIELYNNDDVVIDLEGYYFSEGVEFTFPATSLAQGAYVLIAVDSVVFEQFFGVPAYQFNGGLGNNGERISINNSFGMLVDSVNYDDVAPWPVQADGTGPSLTFCDPGLDNGLGENWSASTEFVAINEAGDSVLASPGNGCASWPVAQFSANNTVVITGGSVTFTDESTGDPDQWIWTFIGGTPGSYVGQTPPAIAYNSPGVYDVILFVSNSAGSSTEEKIDYIHVGNVPVADFSGNPLSLYEGEKVDFTDLSAGSPGTWLWEFEGGVPATSDIQNPTDIQYPAQGLYTVTLTVTNLFGSDVIVKEEYIDVIPVGLDENSVSAIQIYPNPNNGSFRLVNPFSEEMLVSVYSVYGQLVNKISVKPGDNSLSLTRASAGIYVVRFGSKDGKIMKTERMVIY